ncbi:stabilizer of axonemal microtubules 1-like isoform X2 [Pseudochaenichthys georgianus]|uniref:stabilizer of axonemal microtubules 1-like isoform X2 n=1 Tax=Pseudochaenichthys georgianus TaxID=52239 RepID=UPI0039C1A1D1
MSTEYQEKFPPPRCHTAMVTSAPQKAPYHTLKGTIPDKGSLIVSVTHKYTHHPPEAPQQSLPPKVQRRCNSAPQNPARSIANQVAAMFYTSVYKDDFQAWKVIKRQPFKLTDSLKVNLGLVAPICTSKQSPFQKVHVGANCKTVPKELEPQPIESITSYRSDYVAHPVQPRKRRERPVQQNKDLLQYAAVPLYREVFDAAHKSFENGSPENPVPGPR